MPSTTGQSIGDYLAQVSSTLERGQYSSCGRCAFQRGRASAIADSSLIQPQLGRNFVMNPQQGLKISAFKHAAQNRNDHELKYLARYVDMHSSAKSHG